MNATEKTIAQQLEADGWSIEVETVDAGGYDRPSKFNVAVKRNGQRMTTPYSKGCGLRIWKQHLVRGLEVTHFWDGKIRRGERVPQGLPKLTANNERNEQVIREFDAWTQPEPVTLDEVVWSLASDSSSVRYGQTFEDFCGDCGYDTDSREAERIYNACRDTWSGLVRLGADFDKLDELFQDY